MALGFIMAWMLLSSPWRYRIGAGILLCYVGLIGLGVVRLRLGFFGPVVSRGRRTTREVALTFDDGPDPKETPVVLDFLKRHGVSAAFFCIGEHVRKNPDMVKRMVAEGHVVGNHSYRHAWWTNFLWSRRLRKEIEEAQHAIVEACGLRPRYYRPPAGLSNPHLFSALAALELVCVGWTVRPFDTSSGPERVIRRLGKKIRPGNIILLHDAGRDPGQTVVVLEELLNMLAREQLTLTRLDRLIGSPAYQIDEAGQRQAEGSPSCG
jgi:peptidoglycan-N-acetylglucosamine deacetylase